MKQRLRTTPEGLDKAKLVQVGTQRKEEITDFPIDKYAVLMQSLWFFEYEHPASKGIEDY